MKSKSRAPLLSPTQPALPTFKNLQASLRGSLRSSYTAGISTLVTVALLASCAMPRPLSAPASPATPAIIAANAADKSAPKPAAVVGAPSAAQIASAAAAAAGAMPGPGDLRKYEDVVTKDAKTSRGMLLYHRVKERHLFEIPEKLLGRDLLWSVEISQASVGGGFNGLPLGYRVLRFERVDNRIFLRSVSYQNRGLNELKTAADVVDLAPIVMSFAVETEGNERSVELRTDEKKALEKEI